jgi:hypothetical protein
MANYQLATTQRLQGQVGQYLSPVTTKIKTYVQPAIEHLNGDTSMLAEA